MAGKVKTFKDYPTVVQIAEIEKGKYMLNGVFNKEQLHALYSIFEPLSREWRGQYQAMVKAIVEAYRETEKTNS
jgi:hypothetical protein